MLLLLQVFLFVRTPEGFVGGGGGGLKIENVCDAILMTYFRWRNLMTSYFIFLKFYYIVIYLKDHKLAKSRNFRSQDEKKQNKTVQYVYKNSSFTS